MATFDDSDDAYGAPMTALMTGDYFRRIFAIFAIINMRFHFSRSVISSSAVILSATMLSRSPRRFNTTAACCFSFELFIRVATVVRKYLMKAFDFFHALLLWALTNALSKCKACHAAPFPSGFYRRAKLCTLLPSIAGFQLRYRLQSNA